MQSAPKPPSRTTSHCISLNASYRPYHKCPKWPMSETSQRRHRARSKVRRVAVCRRCATLWRRPDGRRPKTTHHLQRRSAIQRCLIASPRWCFHRRRARSFPRSLPRSLDWSLGRSPLGFLTDWVRCRPPCPLHKDPRTATRLARSKFFRGYGAGTLSGSPYFDARRST
jgi:hypothetical protein